MTQVLQYDFLIPIEFKDESRGYFSSKLIRDFEPFKKTKYRLSGTVLFDGKATTVRLYKHQQILIQEKWKTIPSNLQLEKKILKSVSEKLK